MDNYELMIEAGRNLKLEMRDANYTEEIIAEELDINQSTISKYLNGERLMSWETLITLCACLDVEPEDVIYYDEIIFE